MSLKRRRKKSEASFTTSYWKKFLYLLLIPLSFLLKWLMGTNPEFTENYYSRGIYPFIMQPLSRMIGLIPFSLAEILVIFLIIYILYSLISSVIKSIRHRKWIYIVTFAGFMAKLFSILFLLQTLLWGINYERLTFAQNAGIQVRESSVDELEELCKSLIHDANTLRDQVKLDQSGVMKNNGNFKDLTRRAPLGYKEAQKEYPFLRGDYGRPKPVLLSRLMSHSNIIGIYTGITGEANIDIDITDMELPSTIMHEMAHQRGFAHEDEANFISYITCMAHPDIDFKYSGTMLALIHSMNALYNADPERYQMLMAEYGEGLLNDLRNQQQYWSQFQGPAKKVADKINDTYLKLHGEEDGVQSYGRMVDLLLAEYRKK